MLYLAAVPEAAGLCASHLPVVLEPVLVFQVLPPQSLALLLLAPNAALADDIVRIRADHWTTADEGGYGEFQTEEQQIDSRGTADTG